MFDAFGSPYFYRRMRGNLEKFKIIFVEEKYLQKK